jgi:hypothetical protein
MSRASLWQPERKGETVKQSDKGEGEWRVSSEEC